jgi:hypothetical protein
MSAQSTRRASGNWWRTSSTALALLAAQACGGREASWDAPLVLDGQLRTVGLSQSVVVADTGLDRVLVLQADDAQSLRVGTAPVGKNLRTLVRVPGEDRVLALSRGVQPRQSASDEKASLSVLSPGSASPLVARYELESGFEQMRVDPQGEWVVLTGDGSDQSGINNPNELILIDVTDSRFDPIRKTLASFGSQPLRYTFTTELQFPDGSSGRLLLIETERDLKVLNLADPESNEITVQFQRTQSNQVAKPAGLSYSDGDPGLNDDARIAVRFEGQSDVILIEMLADATRPFKLLPQLVDAGGVPSALEIVQTDQGVRLAALLPTQSQVALIDPATTLAQMIDLPASYSKFTRVTADSTVATGDEALLWGENVNSVAFWSLGEIGQQAFRSVEILELQVGIASVLQMSGDTRRRLLQTNSGGQFFVLDLDRRQAFPMDTQFGSVQLRLSPDGARAWAYAPGSYEFGLVDLQSMHVTSLRTDVPPDEIYEIKGRSNRRVAFALHLRGGLGVTLLEGEEPDSTLSRFYSNLFLEGL